jgi:prepilin-type N-terminal cleavage/methylation domain-containing protein
MREVRRRRSSGDAGFTLAEMLVSMIVLSIALTVAFGAVIIVMQKSNDAQQSANAAAELRIGLAQIDRQVRSGNVLFSPSDEDDWVTSCQDLGGNAGTCMRIFTQSNGDQKCVQWQVVDDGSGAGTMVLRSRSWETDWKTGGTVGAWGVVARDLVLDGTAPFTLMGASTPYNERMLQVHLAVQDERRDAPVTVDSSLTGRNTSYGYDSGQCTPVPPA